MGELLPEYLGMAAVNFEVNGNKNSKGKCKPVSNILESLQCFGLYVAVCNVTFSHKGFPTCRAIKH